MSISHETTELQEGAMTADQYRELNERIETALADLDVPWDGPEFPDAATAALTRAVATAHADGLLTDAERDSFKVTRIDKVRSGWDLHHTLTSPDNPLAV